MPCLPQPSSGHCQEVEVGTSKHGIQPVFVFLQAPATNFPVSKLAFDDAKNVLHFAANGGFAFLDPACPVNGVVAHGGNAAGTKIDAVFNGGQAFVMCHFRALLESQIGGITIYDFIIFPDQLRGYRHMQFVRTEWSMLSKHPLMSPSINHRMPVNPC